MTRTTRDVAQEKLRACEGEITKLRRAKIRDKVEIGKLQTQFKTLTRELANTPEGIEVKEKSKPKPKGTGKPKETPKPKDSGTVKPEN